MQCVVSSKPGSVGNEELSFCHCFCCFDFRHQVPGVPIMYISQRKFTVERMPEAFGGACMMILWLTCPQALHRFSNNKTTPPPRTAPRT